MRFEVGNSVTIVHASEEGLAWLYDYLAFEDRTHVYKGEIGQFRLLSLFDNSFPTGLFGGLLEELRAMQRSNDVPPWLDSIEVIDQRVCPCAPKLDADLDWLRDYQRRAVLIAAKKQRGINKIPTGGGKTEVFVALTRVLPCRWLFLAPRMVLVRNAAVRWLKRERERLLREQARTDEEQHGFHSIDAEIEDIDRQLEALTSTDGTAPLRADQVSAGPHVGIVGDGHDTADLKRSKVIFASFATLYAQLEGRGGEILRWAQALCVDESHQQPAETFFAVTQAAENAFYRVGLSGTPLARGDRRNVLAIGALGRLLFEIKAKTLIEAGFFARPTLRFVRHVVDDAPASGPCTPCNGQGTYVDDVTGIEVPCRRCKSTGAVKPKYAAIYRAAVVKSKKRNALIVQIIQCAAKPCMVFVEREEQGKSLLRLAKKAKLDAAFVAGRTHEDWQRERELKMLRRGERQVVITTRVFREGVDVPELAAVVKGSAGKSEISVVQELGRGARPDGSERPTFEFWDVFDEGCEVLAKQAKARIKALERELELPVEIVEL